MRAAPSSNVSSRFVTRIFFLICIVCAGLIVGPPRAAEAYDVELTWTAVGGAVGYNLYVRYDDESYAPPVDLGPLPEEAGGVIRTIARDVLMGPTAYFAVSSYDANGTASVLSNEMSVDYPTAAAVVDSDGDGLTDAEEDTNLNRMVDPGETDPANVDTDGDGTPDGAEVTAGTDPTDPASGGQAICGNGRIDPGEQCDDGAANSDTVAGACTTDCRLPRMCGDADENNQVSLADVILILREVVLNDSSCVACDTNGDGFLQPTDALRLLRRVVGLDAIVWCNWAGV